MDASNSARIVSTRNGRPDLTRLMLVPFATNHGQCLLLLLIRNPAHMAWSMSCFYSAPSGWASCVAFPAVQSSSFIRRLRRLCQYGEGGGSQMPVASWRRDLGAKSDADAKEMKLENLKHVVLVPLEINLYANQVRSATHHLLGPR